MAHFLGKFSPSGHQNKKGTTTPTEDSFIKNGSKVTMFRGEKKLNLPPLDHIF
jgi:hypothetical protein